MPHLAPTGDTLIPALIALEELGYTISASRNYDGARSFTAKRGDQELKAGEPIELLGLVKLVELRGRNWQADDAQVQRVLQQYQLE